MCLHTGNNLSLSCTYMHCEVFVFHRDVGKITLLNVLIQIYKPELYGLYIHLSFANHRVMYE